MKKINTIGIVFRPELDIEDQAQVQNILRVLDKKNLTLLVLEESLPILKYLQNTKVFKSLKFVSHKVFYQKNNIIISLGGDGTLLGICRKNIKRIPIIGVNLGHLGFITQFTVTDFFNHINEILNGQFKWFNRSLYQVSLFGNSKILYQENFFNDVVLHQSKISRLVRSSLTINDEHVYKLASDGLIISTTIGSTAYSLAAGGPIVHPDVNGLVITPICPNRFGHRPMVIPNESIIQLRLLESTGQANITLDGQESFPMSAGQYLEIKKLKNSQIKLITNEEITYFHTLKEKLNYGN